MRSVIKHVFAIFKHQFQIYNHADSSFSISSQVKLVFVLAAIHNFINTSEEELDQMSDSESRTSEQDNIPAADNNLENNIDKDQDYIIKKQDEIANMMWDKYKSLII